MTKMINMMELDKLIARLAAMPEKTPDAFSQKEAVQRLAQQFKAKLAQGYTIENAYAEFMKMEGADLKLSTFRTYLNEALDQKATRKASSKKRPPTTKKSVIAALETMTDTPANPDDMSGGDDRAGAAASLEQDDQNARSVSDDFDNLLETMSPADIERMSGSNGS